jgi:hypothetical protein
MAPRRSAGSALAATEYVMVPLPCPSLPAVIATHGTSLTADHEHSRAAVTAALPVPPVAGIVGVPLLTPT